MNSWITIEFFIDDEAYDMRMWPAVPRIGEIVRLSSRFVKVETVSWGNMVDGDGNELLDKACAALNCSLYEEKE